MRRLGLFAIGAENRKAAWENHGRLMVVGSQARSMIRDTARKELANRPLIRELAFGEALDPNETGLNSIRLK